MQQLNVVLFIFGLILMASSVFPFITANNINKTFHKWINVLAPVKTPQELTASLSITSNNSDAVSYLRICAISMLAAGVILILLALFMNRQ